MNSRFFQSNFLLDYLLFISFCGKMQNWQKKKSSEFGQIGGEGHSPDLHVDIDKPLFERKHSKDLGPKNSS